MKKLRIGNAWIENNKVQVYLNIGSWSSMQKVRQALGKWLPDMPMWKSDNHWAEKSYFRNSFRWDGEYILSFPLESKRDVEQILNFK